MEPLITIIVPVYNGEEFIENCFNSILNQTYKNIEIIIINDGSVDNSPIICDRYAELDERIVVYHQKNMGLSFVRNLGLEMANGDLIGFVDSDDSIHPRMYEILQKNIYEQNADIAMCEVSKVFSSNIKEDIENSDQMINTQYVQLFEQEEAFNNLFNENNLIMVVPWNKLYKKKVLKNIRYPEGKICDDEFVIHHIIQATKKITLTDAALYYYYHHEKSITNKKYNLQRLDSIDAIKDRILFFESQNYNELLQKGLVVYLHLIIIHYYSVQKRLSSEKQVLKRLKSKFREEFINYKNTLNLKSKIELILFFIHPKLYSGFLKLRSGLRKYIVQPTLN